MILEESGFKYNNVCDPLNIFSKLSKQTQICNKIFKVGFEQTYLISTFFLFKILRLNSASYRVIHIEWNYINDSGKRWKTCFYIRLIINYLHIFHRQTCCTIWFWKSLWNIYMFVWNFIEIWCLCTLYNVHKY